MEEQSEHGWSQEVLERGYRCRGGSTEYFVAVNTSWSERAEVNRLSMGISERRTSVGLGTRGVSLGTDASPRTTRADAGVAVASAAVALSSLSLSLTLSSSPQASSRLSPTPEAPRLVSFAQLVSIRFLAVSIRIAVPRAVASLPPARNRHDPSPLVIFMHHQSAMAGPGPRPAAPNRSVDDPEERVPMPRTKRIVRFIVC